MLVVDVTYRSGRQFDTDRVYARTNGAEKAIAVAREIVVGGDGVAEAVIVGDDVRRAEYGLPSPPEYLVAIEWRDGLEEDVDEIVVLSASASGAVSKAKAVWRRTKGKDYPTCRMCGAWLMTVGRMDTIA